MLPRGLQATCRAAEAGAAVGRVGILFVELGRGHVKDIQIADLILSNRIGDLFRIELLVDVGFQPHCLHAFDISGARAKAKPVEDVDNALFFSQILRFCALLTETRGCAAVKARSSVNATVFFRFLNFMSG